MASVVRGPYLKFSYFCIFAERFFQYPIYKISSSIKLNRQIIQTLHLLSKYKFHILDQHSNICAAAARFHSETLSLEVFLTQQSFELGASWLWKFLKKTLEDYAKNFI